MVYDKIDNLDIYKGLSEDIDEGLMFLKQVTPDIANGVLREINPRVEAIVSKYETKTINTNGYESHGQYVDMQYPIKGGEKVKCSPVDLLNETKHYDIIKVFRLLKGDSPSLVFTIGNVFFLILFPDEGHMLCVDVPLSIMKITLKVRVNNQLEIHSVSFVYEYI